MKLGIISDLHGDPVNLELAWSHLTVMGADRIVCAGDLAGYGPFPDRVVAFMQEHEVPSIRGNHDRWALERGPGVGDEFGGGTPGADALDYLTKLPGEMRLELTTSIAVFHGSPRSDMDFVNRQTHPPRILRKYLVDLRCRLLIIGHTHRPMWFRCPDGLVVNPGSVVSIPRIDSSRSFAMVDLETLAVTFHDVEGGDAIEVAGWE
jgi:putative phosphoesterase